MEAAAVQLDVRQPTRMDARFSQLIERLHPAYEMLVQMSPISYAALPKKMPARGIYLFSEGVAHLYVGRTNRLRHRIGDHMRPGGDSNKATFAFLLARERTGMTTASYSKQGSRLELLKHPVFGPEFVAQKLRVAAMHIRFVEETDPSRQALLEIYAATVLQTRYNSFENH